MGTIELKPESRTVNSPAHIAGIYLDGFATTILAPEARSAILDAWELPANPASPHALGERAADIADRARRQVAELAGCAPAELVFTSGATEADNLAITGVARMAPSGRRRVVVSAVEHRAVLEPTQALRAMGFEVAHAPVDARGIVDLARLADVIGDDCWLVSVMTANNETGVVQPVAEITRMAHERGALMHTDAAQALGKTPVDLAEWEVDYASVTAHKMHGPVGVGALYVAAGAPTPAPLQVGGGQQAGRRAGTEAVALMAGFGAAAALANASGTGDQRAQSASLDSFLKALTHEGVVWEKISADARTIPGGCAIVLDSIDADEVCQRLQSRVFISTCSACSSGQIGLSHVLRAMGVSDERGRSVIRVMTSRYVSKEQATAAGTLLAEAVRAS